ncbi:MAG: DinB family protein [candidate division KSB1 bacterium]|nr:DinB family protein [candidate division KSB1 bacterium]MDZ7313987.1 DinB family protein [candidate division KSB1 bacterium]
MESSLTPKRKHILRRLDESLEILEKNLTGLAAPDWQRKPAPDRWSVAEIVHHLVLVEVQRLQWLKDLLAGRRESAPPRDEPIPDLATYRRKKQRVQAKEDMQPTAGISSKTLLAAFRRGRAETKAFACEVDLKKLQEVWLITKTFGPLNGVEYLEFLAAHTERHADQIEKVRKEIS